MPKYFDIHNHLFNKDFLAKELLYRLLKEFKKFLHLQGDDRGFVETTRGLKKVIQALKRFTHAIRVFTRRDSTAIYEEIDKTYKGQFILTPLTFDLTWCFASSADRDIVRENVSKVFEKEMETMFEMVEQKTRSFSRDINDATSREEDELWKEYQAEKAKFMESARELQGFHQENLSREINMRGTLDIPDSVDGFKEQIKQLEVLKQHLDYKDMIFPFLAVDPRRPDIAKYAVENMGKGKLFIGLKLYCPNGYSPTDPLLFGPEGERGGIYAFCEDNGIPVTAHNSDGGFATLAKSVVINGDIHVNGQLHHLDNEKLIFSTSILEKDAVYERAVTLNHPMIWEKVVQKYPNLILNLAHFGGGDQLNAALDNPGNMTLWSNRIISLVKDQRYKVYTDLSCSSNFEVIRKFIASPVYQEIKSRTLYGSDFILLLLFENDFDKNVEQFMTLFGSDFDIIAGTNPKEFLKNVL